MRTTFSKRSSGAVTAVGLVLVLVLVPMALAASSAKPLKKGLKVFVIPKNLGNPYFTTADSVKSGGALAALKALGEKGTETSGTAATAASQIPAIKAAITKGANALIVSATDASALCPTLRSAMKKHIAVVTYDSDAPACRSLFINQADTAAIGRSEVDAARKADRQLGRDRDRLRRCVCDEPERMDQVHEARADEAPRISSSCPPCTATTIPTTSTQVTQGLLQQYPNLKGIISPTTVGSPQRPRVLDTPQYRGKVKLTGSRHAELAAEVRQGRDDHRVRALEPREPRLPGCVRGCELRVRAITGKAGQRFTAGKLGKLQGGGQADRPARPAVRVQQGETSTSSTSKSTEWRCRVDARHPNHWRPRGRQEHMVRS